MGIIYDVPRIGERRDFGQQGPTCWYYAAKMLMKFHGLTQKGTDTYDSLKQLHQLRRVLTDFNFDYKKETKEELEKRKAFLDKLPGIISMLESKGVLGPEQSQQLLNLRTKAEGLATNKEQIRKAIRALDECTDDGLNRLELLTRFVPAAGFTRIERKYWSGADKLEEVAQTWGPIYAGGNVSSISTQRAPTGGQTKSGDRVIEVREFKKTGSHAIVLAGINGDTVYYKDPNRTDELRTIDRNVFYNSLHETSDFMIGIWCREGLREVGNYMQCVHMRTKKTVVV